METTNKTYVHVHKIHTKCWQYERNTVLLHLMCHCIHCIVKLPLRVGLMCCVLASRVSIATHCVLSSALNKKFNAVTDIGHFTAQRNKRKPILKLIWALWKQVSTGERAKIYDKITSVSTQNCHKYTSFSHMRCLL